MPLGGRALTRSRSSPSDLAGISVNGTKLSSPGSRQDARNISKISGRKRTSAVKPQHPPNWFANAKEAAEKPCEERKVPAAVSETKAAFCDVSMHVEALTAPSTIYSLLRAKEFERVSKNIDSFCEGPLISAADISTTSAERAPLKLDPACKGISGLPGPHSSVSETRTLFRHFSASEIANAKTVSPQMEEIQRVKDRRERVLQQRAAAFAKAHGVANPLQQALATRGDREQVRPVSAPPARMGSTNMNKTLEKRMSPAAASKDHTHSQRKPLTFKELIKDDGLRKHSLRLSASSTHSNARSAVTDESPAEITISNTKASREHFTAGDCTGDTTILPDQKGTTTAQGQNSASGEAVHADATVSQKGKPPRRSIVPDLKALILEYKNNHAIDDEDGFSSRSTAATSCSGRCDARSSVSTARSSTSLGSGIAPVSPPSVSSVSLGSDAGKNGQTTESISRVDCFQNMNRPAFTERNESSQKQKLGRVESLQKLHPATTKKGYGVGDLLRGPRGHASNAAAVATQQPVSKFEYSWNQPSADVMAGAGTSAITAKVAVANRARRPASAGAMRKPDVTTSEAPRAAAYVHCKVVPDGRSDP